MKITILTLFPTMVSAFMNESIVKRAQEKGLVQINIINLRDFAKDAYHSVDDRPYGGGAGMILRIDILHEALQSVIAVSTLHREKQSKSTIATSSTTARKDKQKVVLTSAKGKQFDQKKAQKYSRLDHLIII